MYNNIQKINYHFGCDNCFIFFLANTNFYPQLFTYQGGKPLADITKVLLIQKMFISGKIHLALPIIFILLLSGRCIMIHCTGKSFWLIYQRPQQAEIDSAGFVLGKTFSVPDYEITRLKQNFIDPKTRKETLDK